MSDQHSKHKKPPQPVHIKGNPKGEEMVKRKGREDGRKGEGRRSYRTSRDSTSVASGSKAPVHPDSPSIPPA